MVKEKTRQGWDFQYLSADLDAFEEARSMGICRAAVMVFQKNSASTMQTWSSLSQGVSSKRRKMKFGFATPGSPKSGS